MESIKDSDFCILVTEPTPFGFNDTVEQYCINEGIPILLTIPLDTQIARYYSEGITLVKGIPGWQGHFIELFDKIKELTACHVGL